MQRSALPRRRHAPPSRETSPKPSRSWLAGTTMPRHRAAAPIGWLSSLTPRPVQPNRRPRMPVKKEPSGRRSVQAEVEVIGTPEDVWQAIASGPGISSWFVPTKLDQRVGGTTVSSFGPGNSMDSVAKITEWQPPRRFVAESEGGSGGPGTVATEWTVEAK